MEIRKSTKGSFSVIGKEGTTEAGRFFQRLWEDADAPEGWTKWMIPGFAYLCAVQVFTCPQTGRNYMFFPIGKL